MVKCEYCGKEISVLAVRYTWLEKGKKAIHDKCLKRQNEQRKIKADELIMDELEALFIKAIENLPKELHDDYNKLMIEMKKFNKNLKKAFDDIMDNEYITKSFNDVQQRIDEGLKALGDEVKKISKDYQKRIEPIHKSMEEKLKNIKDKNN